MKNTITFELFESIIAKEKSLCYYDNIKTIIVPTHILAIKDALNPEVQFAPSSQIEIILFEYYHSNIQIIHNYLLSKINIDLKNYRTYTEYKNGMIELQILKK